MLVKSVEWGIAVSEITIQGCLYLHVLPVLPVEEPQRQKARLVTKEVGVEVGLRDVVWV
jgi:hypothetical protein